MDKAQGSDIMEDMEDYLGSNFINDAEEVGGSESIDDDIDLNEAQIQVLYGLKCAQEDWPVQGLSIQGHFLRYSTWKGTLSRNLNRLRSMQNSISKEYADHNSLQERCKVQSFYGGALGLVGVLAAPVSGGLSLALTFGSAASQFHGLAKEHTSKNKLNTTAAQMMEEALELQTEIANGFRRLDPMLRTMDSMVQQTTKIKQNITEIGLHNSEGPSLCRFFFKVTENQCVPLKKALSVLSMPTKPMGETLIKKRSTVSKFQSTTAFSKHADENMTQAGFRGALTGVSLATQNSKAITQTTAKTAQLAQNTIKSVATATGITKSASTTATLSSKVAQFSGQLAEKTNKGFQMTKQAFTKSFVGNTAKATTITSSISKFNVALSAVCVCTDLYSLATHKGPAKSPEENDIQTFIGEIEKHLESIDEFVCDANELYIYFCKIIQDISR